MPELASQSTTMAMGSTGVLPVVGGCCQLAHALQWGVLGYLPFLELGSILSNSHTHRAAHTYKKNTYLICLMLISALFGIFEFIFLDLTSPWSMDCMTCILPSLLKKMGLPNWCSHHLFLHGGATIALSFC